MKQLKEEVLAVASVIGVVLVGSLAFVTLTMPFVFPFVAVGVIAYLWRRDKGSSASPRTPVAKPPRRVKPMGRHPRPLPA